LKHRQGSGPQPGTERIETQDRVIEHQRRLRTVGRHNGGEPEPHQGARGQYAQDDQNRISEDQRQNLDILWSEIGSTFGMAITF
jgi:hypothetical protein